MNISTRASVSSWTRPFHRITSSLESFSNCGNRTALQKSTIMIRKKLHCIRKSGHNDYIGNDDDDENDEADVGGEGMVLYLLSPETKTKTNRKLTKIKSPHSKSLIIMMVNTPRMILMVMIDD